jgi:hypothetical protein
MLSRNCRPLPEQVGYFPEHDDGDTRNFLGWRRLKTATRFDILLPDREIRKDGYENGTCETTRHYSACKQLNHRAA